MCVLALAFDSHPEWRLVLAGNRDELHARPSAPLHRWDRPPHLLAGQDLMSGGTWLGVSEEGRLAVVTNLRGFGPPAADAPSRGLLLRDFLAGEGAYARPSEAALAPFNPFNMISLEGDDLVFRANRPMTEQLALRPGLYGLSNGALDAPWPKTARLKARLGDWLAADGLRAEALLDVLKDDELPPTPSPAVAPSDAQLEPAQSPIFIRNPLYGTRCSTVVAIDRDGRGLIVERRYDAAGEPVGRTELTFSWPLRRAAVTG